MKKITLFTTLVLALLLNAFADNPLISHIYTADPSARVFNDTLYVFPSHDLAETADAPGYNGFRMEDYHVFSSTDLMNFTDHGVILSDTDVDWVPNDKDAMWAPDCNTKDGKYYFYFPGDFKVGLAIADHPTGPYTPLQQPIEHAYNIDPNIFIDDDGTPYLYYGGGDYLNGMRLKDDMYTPDMEPVAIQSLQVENYKEGPWVFKRNGTYYFTYPVDLSGSEQIHYATGSNPLGPFTPRGTIMDGWTDGCWTNHHSIVEYRNQWYIFYHHKDISGDGTLRSMCADKLFFNSDGTIQKVTPTLRGIGIRKANEDIQVDRYSEKSNVEVAVLDDNEPVGFKTEQIKNNGWIKYNDVDFGSASYSKVLARVASASSGGQIEIRLGSSTGQLLAAIDVPNTGGLTSWTTLSANITSQPTGLENLVCVFKTPSDNSFVLNWVKFAEGNSILVSKSGTGNGLVKLNGSILLDENQISTILSFSSSNDYNFSIETIPDNEFVEWQKNGSTVSSITNVQGGDEIVAVFNYVQPPRDATSRIEVEDYNEQMGIQTESCSEGGQNIGFIQDGDYIRLDLIDFGSGVDKINIRAAAAEGNGNVNLYLDSKSGNPIATVAIPATGDFQNWSTVSQDISSISGMHDIYLEFTGGAGYLFNLNWIQFGGSGTDPDPDCSEVSATIEAESYSDMSGVQTETCTEGGENVGWVDAGDWMEYCIDVPTEGSYTVDLRVASLAGAGSLEIQIDGTTQTSVNIPNTGGWQAWTIITSSAFNVTAGTHTVRLYATAGGFNVNWLVVDEGGTPPTEYTLSVNSGSGSGNYTAGTDVSIAANTVAGQDFLAWAGDVSALANVNSAITTVTMPTANVTVTATYEDEDPGTCTNNVNATIEAEAYDAMSGIDTENCSEGGENVGWIDAGDWMEYCIDIPTNGNYEVDLRLASAPNAGVVEIQIDGASQTSVDVPATGGWQVWETATSTAISLTSGEHTIKLLAIEAGFNVNWIVVKSVNESGCDNSIASTIEAEDYDAMSGVQTESCSEGGENVGWIDANDWMEYCIDIPADGNYTADLRLATEPGSGVIQIQIDDITQTIINVPATGGWQNWETVTSSEFSLTAGEHTIKLNATEGGFNINWLVVIAGTKSANSDIVSPIADNEVNVYPNPFSSELTISFDNNEYHTISIIDIYGKTYMIKTIEENESSINLSGLEADLKQGVYFIRLNGISSSNTLRVLKTK